MKKLLSKATADNVKTAVVIGFAYVGVIVGAGFASGQEILQYFVAHGVWGFAGGVTALILFSLTGLILLQFGAKFNARSHKEVLNKIATPFTSAFLDWSLTFSVLLVGIVMVAGAGSNLAQQFGLPLWVGSAFISVLMIVTGLLNTTRVVRVISAATPFLLLFVLIASGYALLKADWSALSELSRMSREQVPITPFWMLSAVNYVSFNLMMSSSMAMVMGGNERSAKVAGVGGMFGGFLIGAMILMVSAALFLQLGGVAHADMPLLELVNQISPTLSFVMAIVLFAMIFNTGLSCFYAFASRMDTTADAPASLMGEHKNSSRFNIALILSIVVGFGLSFAGFKALLSFFYPIIGYIGIVMIMVLLIAWFKNTHRRIRIARDKSNNLTFIDTQV